MNLENIVLNEVSQTQKNECHIISLIYEISKCQIMETESKTMEARDWGWGGGKEGRLVKGTKFHLDRMHKFWSSTVQHNNWS